MTEETRSFTKLIEKNLTPVILASTIASVISSFVDYGVVIISLTTTIITGFGCYFLFTRKVHTIIEPRREQAKFSGKEQALGIAVFLLALSSFVYSMMPPKNVRLPTETFILINNSGEDLNIDPNPEFFITLTGGPFVDNQVGSGRLNLEVFGNKVDKILLPKDASLEFTGVFPAAELFKPFLDRNDSRIIYMWHDKSKGISVKVGPLLFDYSRIFSEAIFLTFERGPTN